MKKILGIVLSAVLLMGCCTTAYANVEVDTFKPYINGYDDGTVKPDGLIQRNEIAKILSVITGEETENNLYEINDVPKDNWCYEHIYKMVTLGIMDLDNIEIKSGTLSTNKIISAIYNGTNISITPQNFVNKTPEIDALGNSNEIYSFVASITSACNKMASETGVNVMESGDNFLSIDVNLLDKNQFTPFTVATFLYILENGGYKVDYVKIANQLGVKVSEINSFDINKADNSISGNFRPDDKLTRTELAVALYRIMDGSKSQGYSKNAFDDMENLTTEQKIAINYLVEKGIVKGKEDGLFHPTDNISRAEVVVMINRAFGDKLQSDTGVSIPVDLAGHWSEKEFVRALVKK